MASVKQRALYEIKRRRLAAESTADAVAARLNADARYAELNSECVALGFKIARLGAFNEDTGALKAELAKKKAEREVRLKELGYAPDDLLPHYRCSLCKDTGSVNGEDCTCLKELVYEELRAGSLGVPTDVDAFDENMLKGIPESMRPSYSKAYAILARYVAEFPDNKISVIGLCGPVGCGKSFAAGVLANALMRKGYSVLFINAVQLNEIFLRYHRAPISEKADIFFPLRECDLMVIDDLGAEPLFNNVTANYLYALLSSEREGRFVITTNLDFDSLRARYGDRVASRLADRERSRFYLLEGKDLRLARR